ncbi:sensor histidine kinase [Clostridium guangxiense]|uniref:sensor histidine kinase n=1 Tax=Clostridium guangxiense TaxID=1662055 RepID=UPI001E540787|nr:HAMP domain-containing sensor histidine kinase [Clostridium guangxiense]MCD2348152.1 HAMP domain-containing histidine kinase [Clostridium guangxiense]
MKKVINMSKRKSLKYQLLTRMFLLLILFLIIAEVFQYFSLKHYLCKSREQVLESRMHNVSQLIPRLYSKKDVIKSADELVEHTIDMNITSSVIDNEGNIIASESRYKHGIPAPRLAKNDYTALMHQKGNLEGYTLVKNINGELDLVIWRKIGDLHSSSGLVQLSTEAEPIISVLHKQLSTYIFACLIILILGVIIGGAVLKRTLKPLYSMTNTVKQITPQELNKRLPVNNEQLEIDSLSIAFNGMLERIETSFKKENAIKKKMQQFISDASHELRTPLTSIRGFVEVLLMGAAKDEKKLNIALNSILTESERLTELVNELLMLTRLDRQVWVDMSKENMKNIIEEVYPQLKILSKNRKINLNLSGDMYFWGNKNQIKQVIFNIVQNAINHTDEKEGTITISLDKQTKDVKNFLVLKISDNGTGISESDLVKIFDRFFRSESHRSRHHGGYGLGLSIVKSIIDSHKGTIDVKSSLNSGTTFYIYLNRLI